MKERSKNATMKDVAIRAGVSVGTVSRVINGKKVSLTINVAKGHFFDRETEKSNSLVSLLRR